MNTKTKFFETKEQYLNFRKAFASAVNDPRAKKGKPDPNNNGHRARGWMTGAHFMLLNCIRGIPTTRGFNPMTKNKSIECCGYSPEHNIEVNKRILENYISMAKQFIAAKPADMKNYPSWRYGKAINQEEANNKQQAYYLAQIQGFLEPFAGTLTPTDLSRVDINSNMVKMVEEEKVVVNEPVPVQTPVPEKKGLLSRIFS